MDHRITKLKRKLGDAELAGKLVNVGLDTPRKLKAADDKDIKAISGVGQSGADKVRAVIPKIK